jgi:hypothetical protein
MKDILVKFAGPFTIFKKGISDTGENIDSGEYSDSVGVVITNVTQTAMFIVGIVAVLMLILGGIWYATSAGNEEKMKTAKRVIIGALIGLAFAVLAYAIASFVQGAVT